MHHALEVRHETFDGVQVVRLSGSLDAESAGAFQKAVEPLCSQPGARVVLDCANLDYINSASLGLLNKYSHLCGKSGGALAVCGLTPRILEVVKLLGLDASLKVCKSAEAALKEVKKA